LSARLYVTAHGLYEIEINGQRAGDHALAPGWTSYAHRLRYQTHDVTGHLRGGANAIGAWLADGWYRGRLGFGGGHANLYGDRVALIAQLEITYCDETIATIGTDGSWRAAHSPIASSGLLDGETYDACQEWPGWSQCRVRRPRLVACGHRRPGSGNAGRPHRPAGALHGKDRSACGDRPGRRPRPGGLRAEPRRQDPHHRAIAQWLHTTVAGLTADAPGYRDIIFRPRPGGGLTWASAAHESPYGRVAIRWELHPSGIEVHTTVPTGTSARIEWPDGGVTTLATGTTTTWRATRSVDRISAKWEERRLQI
jgi:hypothetical protein